MSDEIEVEVRKKKDNKKQIIILAAMIMMFVVGGVCGYIEGTILARNDCTGKCDEFMEENCLRFDGDDVMDITYDNIDYGGWNVNISELDK